MRSTFFRKMVERYMKWSLEFNASDERAHTIKLLVKSLVIDKESVVLKELVENE